MYHTHTICRLDELTVLTIYVPNYLNVEQMTSHTYKHSRKVAGHDFKLLLRLFGQENLARRKSKVGGCPTIRQSSARTKVSKLFFYLYLEISDDTASLEPYTICGSHPSNEENSNNLIKLFNEELSRCFSRLKDFLDSGWGFSCNRKRIYEGGDNHFWKCL